jgi:hypothetical protein
LFSFASEPKNPENQYGFKLLSEGSVILASHLSRSKHVTPLHFGRPRPTPVIFRLFIPTLGALSLDPCPLDTTLPAQPVRCLIVVRTVKRAFWLHLAQLGAGHVAGFRYKLDVISCSELDRNQVNSSPKLHCLRCSDHLSPPDSQGLLAWHG